jgi:hypothetical protein
MALDSSKVLVGAPCKRCGCQEHWLSSGGCVECARVRGRTPEQRARTRAWYAAHKEEHKKTRDSHRARNKAKIHAYNSAYRKANLGLYTAHGQAYRLRKKKAMPAWAEEEAISRFYEARPEGHHVDHVIPLRGRTVSGLHVLANLQYLPALENNKKGNRYHV